MLRSLATALLLALGLVSSAHAQAVNISIANEGATGTTLNKLAKLTGAPSTAIITATTDTQGALGIVVGWTGTSATTGNAVIARQGIASCVFDGAVTAGDYVQISTTTAGDCHDGGATRPTTGQILGRVLATNATPGTTPQAMTVSGPEVIAAAVINASQSFTAGQAVTPTTASPCGTQSAAGTMTVDFSTSNSCLATFGAGNLTIANPSNIKAGQTYTFVLTQDGVGSRTVTWGTDFKWAGATAPTLSTTASAVDVISCLAYDTTHLACTLAVKGAS